MVFAEIFAGLLGALMGAVLIAGAVLLAFRVFGLTLPSFGNAWKAAFLASAAVIVADGLGSALLSGTGGAILVLVLGLTGAFLAYDRVLETPEGEPMGRKTAALALATHGALSLAMFIFVLPGVLALVT